MIDIDFTHALFTGAHDLARHFQDVQRKKEPYPMTPNHKKTVYLAGPITGLSYRGCTDWRKVVAAQFAPDIKCADPLRGSHEFLKAEQSIADHYPTTLYHSEAALFKRDLIDVRTCDLVFLNLLGATDKSTGSTSELAWAFILEKPVVLVMEPSGNPHEHAFVRQMCPFRVDNLGDAMEVARSILLLG